MIKCPLNNDDSTDNQNVSFLVTMKENIPNIFFDIPILSSHDSPGH
jgi:hypothetical protein